MRSMKGVDPSRKECAGKMYVRENEMMQVTAGYAVDNVVTVEHEVMLGEGAIGECAV
jgi:hypothetical protein